MRYRRWIREKEITPLLEKITRRQVPLQHVRFWPTKDTPEEDEKELVPLRI